MKQPYNTTIYNTALYLRLSRDDELQGESGSIQTQRMMLRQYAAEHGLTVVDEYIDDGWSGTNFERPSFQRMIDDIEDGKINCVVTKDLSRLGRNYILTGQYTEIYFPSKGVRYIAINDNVDTINGESELAPFLNILNEMHARQTSKKVKAAMHTRFANGAHYGAYAPLGYVKDPDKKGHLLIDPETRWIVEKIFDLAVHGRGAASITRILVEEKVPTPGWLNYERYGTFANIYAGAPAEKAYAWTIAQVKSILKEETYIGHSVHNKQSNISFKNKKKVRKPQEEWYRVENTHEAIISEEVFQKVQELIASRRRKRRNGTTQIFAGLIKCADCGWSLAYGENKQNKNPYGYYHCSKNGQGLRQCSMHYIRYDVLYAYVLARLQYWSMLAQKDEDKLLKRLLNVSDRERNSAKKKQAAVKVCVPGRCFRNEDLDACHENTFFQLEGMVIDENISIPNLIYTMEGMLKEVFKKDVKVRLRPGYFPFTEPGFELDCSCTICDGKGCPTCKNSGWLELCPCGMIHPNVLKEGGIDSTKYSGFAFGLGLTRLAMMKYKIGDIRVLNSGDLRYLEKFDVK